MKNQRPISLLCSDYKILTNVLSNRLKLTSERTISIEQICEILNRSIFSDLFTVREIINHSSTKNINSFVMSIAIDKVDREFLHQIMRQLGYSNFHKIHLKALPKHAVNYL